METELDRIYNIPRHHMPRPGKVFANPMPDGMLLLQFKDAPFDRSVLSRLASDGKGVKSALDPYRDLHGSRADLTPFPAGPFRIARRRTRISPSCPPDHDNHHPDAVDHLLPGEFLKHLIILNREKHGQGDPVEPKAFRAPAVFSRSVSTW